jgi:hypothetical protein
MISCISGLPGKGKNVYATYLAKKHFRHENSIFKRFKRHLMHEDTYINNVYTSYPILLDKKRLIFSNLVTLYDLNGKYRFKKNSLIIIDEVQSFYDSDEYKDFPKNIAIFNQFHRHFDIKDIYYISQHPSRIVKKLRNVSCQFVKIRKFVVIPLINLGVMYYSNYYEFEDYGKWHHPAKELKNYDVDNHFVIFRVKPIFKSYFSKYLSVLNKDKPLYNKGQFKSTSLTKKEINSIFNDIGI